MTELHYKDAVHWAQCLNVRLQVRTHKSLQFLILTMCLIIWFSQVHQFYIKRLFPPNVIFASLLNSISCICAEDLRVHCST